MIVCPVALQGVLNTMVNLMDTLMTGTIRVTIIAAVGLTNRFSFVFSLLVFEIVSGSGVLTIQLWGNGDLRNIRKVLGLSMLLVLTGALFFVMLAPVSPQSVIRIFTTSHDSVELGSKYLEIAVLTCPSLTMTNVYMAIFGTVDKVVFPVAGSCIAIAVDICLNYVLIFDKLSVPAMGVSGMTVATLIARTIETVLILGYIYGKRFPVAYDLQDLLGWSKLFASRFFGTSAPVIANEFMWRLDATMYSLAYGRMGDRTVAVITITTTVQDILVILFRSLNAVTAVILGSELKTGHLRRTKKCAVHFFILQFIAAVGAVVVSISIHWPTIGLYNITPGVTQDVSLCALTLTAYIPVKMFNYANMMGVLRNGNDTKMCLSLDTSGTWFIGVPLVSLGVPVWRLPICTVYTLVIMERVYETVLGYIRYRQKKWFRNLASDVG